MAAFAAMTGWGGGMRGVRRGDAGEDILETLSHYLPNLLILQNVVIDFA